MLKAIEAALYALLLLTTAGPRGEIASVPPALSVRLFYACDHHGIDEMEAAGLLLGEHRGQVFEPLETGRFGMLGGEAGELSVWRGFAREATERCNADERAKHHRYRGRGPCLYIEGQRIVYKSEVRGPDVITRKPGCVGDGLNCVARWLAGELLEPMPDGERDLFERAVNVEAGVIAWRYVQAKTAERYGPRYGIDWRAGIRCSRTTWRHLSTSRRQREALERCKRSIHRVLRWEAALRRADPPSVAPGWRRP